METKDIAKGLAPMWEPMKQPVDVATIGKITEELFELITEKTDCFFVLFLLLVDVLLLFMLLLSGFPLLVVINKRLSFCSWDWFFVLPFSGL